MRCDAMLDSDDDDEDEEEKKGKEKRKRRKGWEQDGLRRERV